MNKSDVYCFQTWSTKPLMSIPQYSVLILGTWAVGLWDDLKVFWWSCKSNCQSGSLNNCGNRVHPQPNLEQSWFALGCISFPRRSPPSIEQSSLCYRVGSRCCCLVAKSCLTLSSPIDCSPPSSSVHGISQARMLEWVAISFSRRSSWPREQIHVSCIGGWIIFSTEPLGKYKQVCKLHLSKGDTRRLLWGWRTEYMQSRWSTWLIAAISCQLWLRGFGRENSPWLLVWGLEYVCGYDCWSAPVLVFLPAESVLEQLGVWAWEGAWHLCVHPPARWTSLGVDPLLEGKDCFYFWLWL